METDAILNSLAEFRHRRLTHEAARKYTISVGGSVHNVAVFRDTTVDVLEELSDAHNIAFLGLDKALRHPATSKDAEVLGKYLDMIRAIENLMVYAYELRQELPDSLREDQVEILGDKAPNRIVTLEEVGLA